MARRDGDLDIRLHAAGKAKREREPVRSASARMILTLAIIGLVGCPFLGIAAWTWGRRELRRIRRGQVDPVDEGRIRAGMIVGLVGVIYNLIIWLLVGTAVAVGLRYLIDRVNMLLDSGTGGL